MAFLVDGVAYPNSNWAGPVTDGYLGLRILKDDSACFGWLRMDVADSAKSFTIKDWSFNPEKDTSRSQLLMNFSMLWTECCVTFALLRTVTAMDVSTDSPIGLRIFDMQGKELYNADPKASHHLKYVRMEYRHPRIAC